MSDFLWLFQQIKGDTCIAETNVDDDQLNEWLIILWGQLPERFLSARKAVKADMWTL